MRTELMYLVDIRDAINKIEEYTSSGKNTFLHEQIRQDAVIRNFMVIGEAVKRLTPATTSSHSEIPWKDIAGFRDILIHNYSGIDYIYVWNVIENYLPSLKLAVEKMITCLE